MVCLSFLKNTYLVVETAVKVVLGLFDKPFLRKDVVFLRALYDVCVQ